VPPSPHLVDLRPITATYLWLWRSVGAGATPEFAKVLGVLRASLRGRVSVSELERRMGQVSYALGRLGRGAPLPGYPPEELAAGDELALIEKTIQAWHQPTHSILVSWLVRALPPATVAMAAADLASGVSTTYDVVMPNGTRLAPKAVIGYAGQLAYGAPLLSEDFYGGEATPCFDRIRAAGLVLALKPDIDAAGFEKEVRRLRKKRFTSPPPGCATPPKTEATLTRYARDPAVVAYVLEWAHGRCESCRHPAPFHRPDGEPFLEVHHILPLAESGPDTVANTIALCPNCHRQCHHGANATALRKNLLAIATSPARLKARHDRVAVPGGEVG
jgi:5-methylcytosine-specific restriction endonuclease McrA